MFSVRIVSADHYLAPPIRGLDVAFSDFRGSEIKYVPVVRIFGATPAGQKTCLHLHGVFPYIYVLYNESKSSERYLQQLASSLDRALNIASGQASSNTQHIYKIACVSGIPFYGFHAKKELFLKIYFYNPFSIKKAVDLLQGGAIMNTVFQPHESHIPFILQVFIDYNLYGMNMINIAGVKFRRKIISSNEKEMQGSHNSSEMFSHSFNESSHHNGPSLQYWDYDAIPSTMFLDVEFIRMSSCELEVDAVAGDVLNRRENDAQSCKNPGLADIWQDEKQRRKDKDLPSQFTPSASQERPVLLTPGSERFYRERLRLAVRRALESELEEGEVLDDDDDQVDEDDAEIETCAAASLVELHFSQIEVLDAMSRPAVMELQPVVDEETIQSILISTHSSQPVSDNLDNSQDNSLIKLLTSLANENIQEDSILSVRGTQENDEQGSEDEAETLEMSQQIVNDDENIRCDSDSFDDESSHCSEPQSPDIPQSDGPADDKQDMLKKKHLGTSNCVIDTSLNIATKQAVIILNRYKSNAVTHKETAIPCNARLFPQENITTNNLKNDLVKTFQNQKGKQTDLDMPVIDKYCYTDIRDSHLKTVVHSTDHISQSFNTYHQLKTSLIQCTDKHSMPRLEIMNHKHNLSTNISDYKVPSSDIYTTNIKISTTSSSLKKRKKKEHRASYSNCPCYQHENRNLSSLNAMDSCDRMLRIIRGIHLLIPKEVSNLQKCGNEQVLIPRLTDSQIENLKQKLKVSKPSETIQKWVIERNQKKDPLKNYILRLKKVSSPIDFDVAKSSKILDGLQCQMNTFDEKLSTGRIASPLQSTNPINSLLHKNRKRHCKEANSEIDFYKQPDERTKRSKVDYSPHAFSHIYYYENFALRSPPNNEKLKKKDICINQAKLPSDQSKFKGFKSMRVIVKRLNLSRWGIDLADFQHKEIQSKNHDKARLSLKLLKKKNCGRNKIWYELKPDSVVDQTLPPRIPPLKIQTRSPEKVYNHLTFTESPPNKIPIVNATIPSYFDHSDDFKEEYQDCMFNMGYLSPLAPNHGADSPPRCWSPTNVGHKEIREPQEEAALINHKKSKNNQIVYKNDCILEKKDVQSSSSSIDSLEDLKEENAWCSLNKFLIKETSSKLCSPSKTKSLQFQYEAWKKNQSKYSLYNSKKKKKICIDNNPNINLSTNKSSVLPEMNIENNNSNLCSAPFQQKSQCSNRTKGFFPKFFKVDNSDEEFYFKNSKFRSGRYREKLHELRTQNASNFKTSVCKLVDVMKSSSLNEVPDNNSKQDSFIGIKPHDIPFTSVNSKNYSVLADNNCGHKAILPEVSKSLEAESPSNSEENSDDSSIEVPVIWRKDNGEIGWKNIETLEENFSNFDCHLSESENSKVDKNDDSPSGSDVFISSTCVLEPNISNSIEIIIPDTSLESITTENVKPNEYGIGAVWDSYQFEEICESEQDCDIVNSYQISDTSRMIALKRKHNTVQSNNQSNIQQNSSSNHDTSQQNIDLMEDQLTQHSDTRSDHLKFNNSQNASNSNILIKEINSSKLVMKECNKSFDKTTCNIMESEKEKKKLCKGEKAYISSPHHQTNIDKPKITNFEQLSSTCKENVIEMSKKIQSDKILNQLDGLETVFNSHLSKDFTNYTHKVPKINQNVLDLSKNVKSNTKSKTIKNIDFKSVLPEILLHNNTSLLYSNGLSPSEITCDDSQPVDTSKSTQHKNELIEMQYNSEQSISHLSTMAERCSESMKINNYQVILDNKVELLSNNKFSNNDDYYHEKNSYHLSPKVQGTKITNSQNTLPKKVLIIKLDRNWEKHKTYDLLAIKTKVDENKSCIMGKSSSLICNDSNNHKSVRTKVILNKNDYIGKEKISSSKRIIQEPIELINEEIQQKNTLENIYKVSSKIRDKTENGIMENLLQEENEYLNSFDENEVKIDTIHEVIKNLPESLHIESCLPNEKTEINEIHNCGSFNKISKEEEAFQKIEVAMKMMQNNVENLLEESENKVFDVQIDGPLENEKNKHYEPKRLIETDTIEPIEKSQENDDRYKKRDNERKLNCFKVMEEKENEKLKIIENEKDKSDKFKTLENKNNDPNTLMEEMKNIITMGDNKNDECQTEEEKKIIETKELEEEENCNYECITIDAGKNKNHKCKIVGKEKTKNDKAVEAREIKNTDFKIIDEDKLKTKEKEKNENGNSNSIEKKDYFKNIEDKNISVNCKIIEEDNKNDTIKYMGNKNETISVEDIENDQTMKGEIEINETKKVENKNYEDKDAQKVMNAKIRILEKEETNKTTIIIEKEYKSFEPKILEAGNENIECGVMEENRNKMMQKEKNIFPDIKTREEENSNGVTKIIKIMEEKEIKNNMPQIVKIEKCKTKDSMKFIKKNIEQSKMDVFRMEEDKRNAKLKKNDDGNNSLTIIEEEKIQIIEKDFLSEYRIIEEEENKVDTIKEKINTDETNQIKVCKIDREQNNEFKEIVINHLKIIEKERPCKLREEYSFFHVKKRNNYLKNKKLLNTKLYSQQLVSAQNEISSTNTSHFLLSDINDQQEQEEFERNSSNCNLKPISQDNINKNVLLENESLLDVKYKCIQSEKPSLTPELSDESEVSENSHTHIKLGKIEQNKDYLYDQYLFMNKSIKTDEWVELSFDEKSEDINLSEISNYSPDLIMETSICSSEDISNNNNNNENSSPNDMKSFPASFDHINKSPNYCPDNIDSVYGSNEVSREAKDYVKHINNISTFSRDMNKNSEGIKNVILNKLNPTKSEDSKSSVFCNHIQLELKNRSYDKSNKGMAVYTTCNQNFMQLNENVPFHKVNHANRKHCLKMKCTFPKMNNKFSKGISEDLVKIDNHRQKPIDPYEPLTSPEINDLESDVESAPEGVVSPIDGDEEQLLLPITRIWNPAFPPPTILSNLGLPSAHHKEAFCKNPDDLKDQLRFSETDKLKSNLVSELMDFTASSQNYLEIWRTFSCNSQSQGSFQSDSSFNVAEQLKRFSSFRAAFTTSCKVILTPSRPPPTSPSIEWWLSVQKLCNQIKQIAENKQEIKVTEKESDDELEKAVQDWQNKVKDLNKTTIWKTHRKDSSPKKLKINITAASECRIKEAQEVNEIQQVENQNYYATLAPEKILSTNSQCCDLYESSLSLTSSSSSSTTLCNSDYDDQFSNDSSYPAPKFSTPFPLAQNGPDPSSGYTSISVKESSVKSKGSELRAKRHLSMKDEVMLKKLLLSSQFQTLLQNPSLKRITSQLDGPSPTNTYGFKISQQNLQEAKTLHEVQHLTLMSVEMHARTRGDLRPDPQIDQILAVFYCIQTDTPGMFGPGTQQLTGVIIIDSSQTNQQEAYHRIDEQHPNLLRHHLLIRSAITNLNVTFVQEEKVLFDVLVELVKRWDPDILIGYEIQMLSWGYLVCRASNLGITLCPLLARINDVRCTNNLPVDNDFGAELNIVGRIILNLWKIMRHEVTLNIYTFENVAFNVLHQRIPLFSFKTLSSWMEHKVDLLRWRFFEHYLVRVRGNLQLLHQLNVIERTSELARLFGIQFYCVFSRGSQYRVESMMLRLVKPMSYIALSPSPHQRSRMAAPECLPLILEPESKFYTDPVLVLDFQSLYPSMIIAYNYCYSTCLGRVEHLGRNPEFEFGCTTLKVPISILKKLDHTTSISPNGVVFVKSNVRKGILPFMLEEILNTRIMIKKAMKNYKDDKAVQRLLDARQLGLKLIANVTYGYTSANYSGRMPCIEVGDSIISKARETLERAIKLVECNKDWAAKVVYGDTDSLFVLLKDRSKEEAFRIGQEISDAVTLLNPKPVKLKFEKVYLPCLLQTKKRYVGYMYETVDQNEPVFDAKGIETVRRDTCPAVSKMLEKSLRILFSSKDVSEVKQYVQHQLIKLSEGRVTLQDYIFAKEYRGSSGYKPGACVPALQISRRLMQIDRCAEPRAGERVPYVVICGSPGLPLIQLICQPFDVLQDPSLRVNVQYYITKQIIPALSRCFSLLGIDINTWYNTLPKIVNVQHASVLKPGIRKGTITQYFSSMKCPVCGDLSSDPICSKCCQNPQQVVFALSEQVRLAECRYHTLSQICHSCTGQTDFQLQCISLDCPVFFRIASAAQDLGQASNLAQLQKQILEP